MSAPRSIIAVLVLAGLLASACGTLQHREGRGCASRDDTRCPMGAH